MNLYSSNIYFTVLHLSVYSDVDSDPFSVSRCSESEEEFDTDEEVSGNI